LFSSAGRTSSADGAVAGLRPLPGLQLFVIPERPGEFGDGRQYSAN
jgi:hypothetical protein